MVRVLTVTNAENEHGVAFLKLAWSGCRTGSESDPWRMAEVVDQRSGIFWHTGAREDDPGCIDTRLDVVRYRRRRTHQKTEREALQRQASILIPELERNVAHAIATSLGLHEFQPMPGKLLRQQAVHLGSDRFES